MLEWEVAQHRLGGASFSELAQGAGLSVEEIMRAAGGPDKAEALEMFLAGCRVVAEPKDNPEFLRQAQKAVESVG